MQVGYLDSYVQHYASVNPWIDYWSNVQSGRVAVSEAVAPSHLFEKTEFYNDWLRPHGGIEAAAGVKIAADSGETIQLLMHYPTAHAARYDPAAIQVLECVKGSLNRAVAFARTARCEIERVAGAAAIVARHPNAAFVLRADGVLADANAQAMAMFRRGDAAAVRQGKVCLPNAGADALLEHVVARLCRQEPTGVSSISYQTVQGRWQLTFAAVSPDAASNAISTILPLRRMVLVVVADIAARPTLGFARQSGKALFDLTPAETDLCNRLLAGDSLAESAARLQITETTARTRLKLIFSKTGTSRQSELMLLLAQIR